MQADGGRTTTQSQPATAYFNANTGAHFIESKVPLTPLSVCIESTGLSLQLQGNVLVVSGQFVSLQSVQEILEAVYFVFPALLNLAFADPPFVERVDGTIGDTSFRWELLDWKMDFEVTTQEKQERAVAEAWQRLISLQLENRRVVAAIHYFHIACRLARASQTPGEFLSESLLNICKALEVLYPPSGGLQTMDSVRIGLKTLGYVDKEIERDFIPAMALRNNIDVAHVSLTLFTQQQLTVLHAYSERTEVAFRRLLGRVLTKMAAGQIQIEPYTISQPLREVQKIIERIGANLPKALFIPQNRIGRGARPGSSAPRAPIRKKKGARRRPS
jgi:hypothetical protein